MKINTYTGDFLLILEKFIKHLRAVASKNFVSLPNTGKYESENLHNQTYFNSET